MVRDLPRRGAPIDSAAIGVGADDACAQVFNPSIASNDPSAAITTIR